MRCSLSFSALLCGEQNRSILTAQIISNYRRQRQTVQPFFSLHSRCGIFRVFILAQEKKDYIKTEPQASRSKSPSQVITAGPRRTVRIAQPCRIFRHHNRRTPEYELMCNANKYSQQLFGGRKNATRNLPHYMKAVSAVQVLARDCLIIKPLVLSPQVHVGLMIC